MDDLIKANGKWGKWKGKEFLNGLMETYIKDNTKIL